MKSASQTSLFCAERARFHAELLKKILTADESGILSNADRASTSSREIAQGIFQSLGGHGTSVKVAGQQAGCIFEELCAEFLKRTFLQLSHLRPGKWEIKNGSGIADFAQYAHLSTLQKLTVDDSELLSILGNDYIIKPDIVIARRPEPDEQINATALLVDSAVAQKTDIRAANNNIPILHASISCKWTMRSDRAQNSRSEALNLIRNRKGSLPHIAVITAEPLPARIASLALGTGDINCVYHFALHELIKSATDDNSRELLDAMISGKRLRDIADLPLDLAV